MKGHTSEVGKEDDQRMQIPVERPNFSGHEGLKIEVYVVSKLISIRRLINIVAAYKDPS